MIFVKNLNLKQLLDNYLGKIVKMKSDCDMFNDFTVKGQLVDIVDTKNNNELIFKIRRIKDGKLMDKVLDVSSNMSNLVIEII